MYTGTKLPDYRDVTFSLPLIYLIFTSYGELIMTKRLVLLSIGDFLVQNTNLQASSVPATITKITLNTGAANSVLSGLKLPNGSNGIYISSGVTGVTITRCFGTFIDAKNADNISIRKAFFILSPLARSLASEQQEQW